MSNSDFDLMKGVISAGDGVPAGVYNGRFAKAQHVPVQAPDPMTGKGGREYAAARFTWEITDGTYAGKMVFTDTPLATGPKSRFYAILSWLLGKNLPGGDAYDLSGCVGKKYLITMGSKAGKTWVEVTNAMLLPGQ